MRFLFLTIRFLPYWAIPMTLIFGEMALIFRRRGNKKMMMRMAVVSGLFALLTLFFFLFRWDVTLYPWLKERLLAACLPPAFQA